MRFLFPDEVVGADHYPPTSLLMSETRMKFSQTLHLLFQDNSEFQAELQILFQVGQLSVETTCFQDSLTSFPLVSI